MIGSYSVQVELKDFTAISICSLILSQAYDCSQAQSPALRLLRHLLTFI